MLSQPRRSEIIIRELIEEIIAKTKTILHQGDMYTSFIDFQRNPYSVNENVFTAAMQEQLRIFFNQNKSAYNTDALSFLRVFHLKSGLADPCKIDYLIARLNQNCFHHFITIIIENFIKIQNKIWLTVIGKEIQNKVYGDNYLQKLIFIYPLELVNTQDRILPKQHVLTLTIEIILDWQSPRIPTVTLFSHKFELTEAGRQIEIPVGALTFPLQTYIDFLFREIYILSPEKLARINAR